MFENNNKCTYYIVHSTSYHNITIFLKTGLDCRINWLNRVPDSSPVGLVPFTLQLGWTTTEPDQLQLIQPVFFLYYFSILFLRFKVFKVFHTKIQIPNCDIWHNSPQNIFICFYLYHKTTRFTSSGARVSSRKRSFKFLRK